ncbi:hypothetical protein [Paracoccus sp. S1E-3]|uniref:hypothetical protein n=1 Tax=Paracoccus sp. S1E-3 TaxID=2756130 RepID=UPI0015EEA86F|nr:hypothetical protein [Paracoccus sp. S1E-3]MBA4489993.1 hypothetical protein [Paracoccus sp. S1E-3]
MKSIILDANLLVVWIVGACDISKLGTFKRAKAYTAEDFHWIESHITDPKRLATIPNIVTEAGNLLLDDNGDKISGVRELLGQFMKMAREAYISSPQIADSENYMRLGVTDSAIIELCATMDVKVLTADHKLYGQLHSLGYEAHNIWHHKTPK